MATEVLITIPNQGWIRRDLIECLTWFYAEERYRCHLQLPEFKPLENAQHHVIRNFIDGGYDYWLSIDADTVPSRNPLDLVDLDLDIVGCPTPVWQNPVAGACPFQWVAYDYDPIEDKYFEHKPPKGLQRVDAIGGGCFLIARRVFCDLSMQTGAFTRETNQDGTVKFGNDLSFCRRASKHGWKIWAHYDYWCRHYKELDLNEVINAYVDLDIGRAMKSGPVQAAKEARTARWAPQNAQQESPSARTDA